MEVEENKTLQVGEPPLVRNYQDYRRFLKDWFEFKKSLRPSFSYRRFSALLGLKSPNYMQLVLTGQRNMSVELAQKFAKLCSLSMAQTDYFIALVQLESFQNDEQKIEFEKQVLVARKKMATTYLDQLKSEILGTWYHMLVRELVLLPNFEPSGEYISQQLCGLITVNEAENSLRKLVEAGFVKPTVDGAGVTHYVQTHHALDTGDDGVFSKHLMQQHHGETLTAWGKSLAKFNANESELGLLHIPIASEKIPELKLRIRKFQDEIIGWLESEKNPDRVIQLGTYLIPFTGPRRD